MKKKSINVCVFFSFLAYKGQFLFIQKLWLEKHLLLNDSFTHPFVKKLKRTQMDNDSIIENWYFCRLTATLHSTTDCMWPLLFLSSLHFEKKKKKKTNK